MIIRDNVGTKQLLCFIRIFLGDVERSEVLKMNSLDIFLNKILYPAHSKHFLQMLLFERTRKPVCNI